VAKKVTTSAQRPACRAADGPGGTDRGEPDRGEPGDDRDRREHGHRYLADQLGRDQDDQQHGQAVEDHREPAPGARLVVERGLAHRGAGGYAGEEAGRGVARALGEHVPGDVGAGTVRVARALADPGALHRDDHGHGEGGEDQVDGQQAEIGQGEGRQSQRDLAHVVDDLHVRRLPEVDDDAGHHEGHQGRDVRQLRPAQRDHDGQGDAADQDRLPAPLADVQ
jgi:hypothetical protein